MADSIEDGSPCSPSIPCPADTVGKFHTIKLPGSRMPKGMHTYAVHKNIKTAVNQRLIKEGRFDDYRALVEELVGQGIPRSGELSAWKIAAFAFAPISGGPGELKADPYFEQIAAEWAQGKYPQPRGFAKFPSGMTNFEKLNGEPSEEIKEVAKRIKSSKKDWENEWQELAAKVDPEKQPSEVEVVRWVFDHCGLPADQIDPDDVPSVGAVTLLMHGSRGEAGYRDVLNAWLKLMPDRKAIEYEAKFKDDGRSLDMLAEFERQLELEEGSAA